MGSSYDGYLQQEAGFFTTADKGTVAINLLTYKDKINDILNNQNTYEKIISNPIEDLRIKAYTFLIF